MDITRERKAIDAALNNYRAQLDIIPDDLFSRTPPNGGWSFAEVYSHILKATLGASINLERCTHGNLPPSTKGLTLLGRLVMFTGRFPPFKVKVPESIAAQIPAEKISKEEAKNLIIKCRKRIDGVAELLKNSLSDSRSRHPRLGMLNAKQWFKFIRIHTQHHIKQLDRLKNIFNFR